MRTSWSSRTGIALAVSAFSSLQFASGAPAQETLGPSGNLGRAKVPGDTELAAVAAELRTLFLQDVSIDDAEECLEVGTELLSAARESRNDLRTYAALGLAIEITSAHVSSAVCAFEAICEKASRYDVNFGNEVVTMLGMLHGACRAKPDHREALAITYDAIRHCVEREDFRSASRAIEWAKKHVETIREKSTHTTFEGVAERLEVERRMFDAYKKSELAIAKNPTDRSAHESAGLYLCVVRADWEMGIRHLDHGANGQLRECAQAERRLEESDREAECASERRLAVADLWRNTADDLADACLQQQSIRRHAAVIYRSVVNALTGIERKKAEQRIEQVEKPRPNWLQDGLVGEWHFDEGVGTSSRDTSGSGKTATLIGATWAAGLNGGRCVEFSRVSNDVGTYVSVNANSGDPLPSAVDPQTISWWQRVEKYPLNDDFVMISIGTTKPNAVQPGFRHHDGGRITVWGKGGNVIVDAIAPKDAQWHHFCYTYDGVMHKIYVDGKLKNESSVVATPNGAGRLEFGRYDGRDPDYFNGVLDEIRIYRRAVPADQVAELTKDPIR